MKIKPEIMEGIRRHIQPIDGLEHTELLEIEPGHAKIAINVPAGALNLYGTLHGGFLFALCDMVSGMSTYAYEMINVTQMGNIQFLKAITAGRIYVESNAVHRGKKTVVNQVSITDDKGTLFVCATLTMFLVAPITCPQENVHTKKE